MVEINGRLLNDKQAEKLVRKLARELPNKKGSPVRAGLLAATDGAVDVLKARTPRRTGLLQRAVRRTITTTKETAVVLVGYETKTRRAKRTRRGRKPAFQQALAVEAGARGRDGVRAIRNTALTNVFPTARRNYTRGFAASYNKRLRRLAKQGGFRVRRSG